MRPSVPDVHITDSLDAELAAYRTPSGAAITGLILSLLAPLALVDPLLWSLPVIGVIVSLWALRRIRRDSALMGRKIAIVGLMLSLLFGAAAPVEWCAYRAAVRREARQFIAIYFKHLTQGEPQLAHQLLLSAAARQSPGRSVLAFYADDLRRHKQLQDYVGDQPTRTLLALGPRAQVRYYESLDQMHEDPADYVDQVFAVTFEDADGRKSFFIAVRAERRDSGGRADWRIVSVSGGVRPEGW